MDEKELYRLAWERWHDLQYMMLFEEMAELTKAVSKYWRNSGQAERDQIIEEIADVQIMLDQMKQKFGYLHVEEKRQIKLKRLEAMLGRASIPPSPKGDGILGD